MHQPHFHLPQAAVETLLNICLQSRLWLLKKSAKAGKALSHACRAGLASVSKWQTQNIRVPGYWKTSEGKKSPHLVLLYASFPSAAFIDTNSWQIFNFPSNRIVWKSLKKREKIKRICCWAASVNRMSSCCVHQCQKSCTFNTCTQLFYCKFTYDLNCMKIFCLLAQATTNSSALDDGSG